MAGLEALIHAGMVTQWGEGGPAAIHFPRRERETPSPE